MNCELIFWKLHGTFPILPVVDLNLPYEVESLHHAHCLSGNGMRGTIRSDAGSCFICLLMLASVPDCWCLMQLQKLLSKTVCSEYKKWRMPYTL